MKSREILLAVLLTTCTLAGRAEQSTYKGVKILSRSTNPQATLRNSPTADSHSTNPQSVLKLDSTRKVLTSSQPNSTPLQIKYSQITGAEYDQSNQNALTIHYTGSDGSAQQLQVGLPKAQAEEIVNKLQVHTGKTVVRPAPAAR